MQDACDLEPGSVELRFQLGRLLAHAGRYDAALAHFAFVTERAPDFADAWHLHGMALQRLRRDNEARESLRHALRLAPDQVDILSSLARLEFRSGYPSDALPLWQALLRQRPDDIDTRLKTGECKSRLGHHGDAIATYREGLALNPRSAELWLALGQAVEDHGDRDAACEAYGRALALRPGWAFALGCLLALRRTDADDTLLGDAVAVLRGTPPPSDHDRALVGYALGKALDARGDHAAALAQWQDANAARQRDTGPPDPGPMRERVERTIASYTRGIFDDLAGIGSADDRPVFIVGMPRSGTTLTEQILASHPLAHGCGELPDLAMIARRMPHDPRRIGRAQAQAGIERYLAALTRHAPAVARRLVDKEPLNFFHLGLAALLFPRARVIWCRRDPRDIAVSIYGENFAMDETLATDLSGIGHYIGLQQRLMRHWQAVLPLPIMESSYERLVAAPEAGARQLVEFIGLPWDPACLEFHRGEQNVQSPSRWQVRQPVHARSIGRWRNYAGALAPLLEVLDPDGYA